MIENGLKVFNFKPAVKTLATLIALHTTRLMWANVFYDSRKGLNIKGRKQPYFYKIDSCRKEEEHWNRTDESMAREYSSSWNRVWIETVGNVREWALGEDKSHELKLLKAQKILQCLYLYHLYVSPRAD